MFPSAFASLRSDPVSRAYYQRKRDQGKRHNQAVLALAHRRILTLHAMIRDGALYDPPTSHETTHRRLTHHIGAPPIPALTIHAAHLSPDDVWAVSWFRGA